MFQNKVDNEDNDKFDIYVGGTTNLTTTLDANAFISKGHYYQLEEEAQSSTCHIVDQDGVTLDPDEEEDETFFGVEQLTGLTTVIQERFLYNFMICND